MVVTFSLSPVMLTLPQDPKKELMNELKKEDFYPQKNLSTSPSLTTINTKDTASPNLKPNGKDNPACLLNGDGNKNSSKVFSKEM